MASSRLRITNEISSTTDYANPVVYDGEWTASPDEHWGPIRIQADITTATSLDLSPFASISKMIIENQDTTNYVEARFSYLRSSTTHVADDLTFTDATDDDTIVSAAVNFATTSLAEAGMYIRVTNTTEPTANANDGRFLIQTVSSGTITLTSAASLSSSTGGDGGTPLVEIEMENLVRILAGQILVITGPIQPKADLALLANTAACYCEVTIEGS